MNKNQGIIAALLVVLIALVAYGILKPKDTINTEIAVESPIDTVVVPDTVKPIPITTSVTATSAPVAQPTKTFTNTKYNFSVDYPATFSTTEGNDRGFYNETNMYGVSVNKTDFYQKNTDLNVANVVVTVSSATAKCYASNGTDDDMMSIKTINGVSFHYNPKQPFDDAAMGGQRGTYSLFSTVKNGQCYRIIKTIGYRDLHGFVDEPYNYPPHFDEQKVNADLDAIISTFAFK